MSIDEMTGLAARTQSRSTTERTVSPKLDESKYLPLIDGFEMTEAQKAELLKTLWSIMCSFVELGLSVDTCGQVFNELATTAEPGPGDVESKSS